MSMVLLLQLIFYEKTRILEPFPVHDEIFLPLFHSHFSFIFFIPIFPSYFSFLFFLRIFPSYFCFLFFIPIFPSYFSFLFSFIFFLPIFPSYFAFLFFLGLTNYFFSDDGNIFDSKCSTLYQDMDQPLSHYYINSSHNT